MNEEQIEILKRCLQRTQALVKIALKRGENKLAKEMDEEATCLHIAILALER